VARVGRGAPHGVVVAAGNLDAEQVVALGRTGRGGRFGAVSDAARAVRRDTDEVVLDGVPRRRAGGGADGVDAVNGVARSDVAVGKVGRADLVVVGALDANTVTAVGEGAVGHSRRAGRIDTHEVADDVVAVALNQDAVAREAVDDQAPDRAAAAPGAERQT